MRIVGEGVLTAAIVFQDRPFFSNPIYLQENTSSKLPGCEIKVLKSSARAGRSFSHLPFRDLRVHPSFTFEPKARSRALMPFVRN
jgi:hypothetical protein